MFIKINCKGEKLTHLDFSDCCLFTYRARPLTGDIILSNDGIEYKTINCIWTRQYPNIPCMEFVLERTGRTREPSIQQQIRNFLLDKKNMQYDVKINDKELYRIKLRHNYGTCKNHDILISTKEIEFRYECNQTNCQEICMKIINQLIEEEIIK